MLPSQNLSWILNGEPADGDVASTPAVYPAVPQGVSNRALYQLLANDHYLYGLATGPVTAQQITLIDPVHSQLVNTSFPGRFAPAISQSGVRIGALSAIPSVDGALASNTFNTAFGASGESHVYNRSILGGQATVDAHLFYFKNLQYYGVNAAAGGGAGYAEGRLLWDGLNRFHISFEGQANGSVTVWYRVNTDPLNPAGAWTACGIWAFGTDPGTGYQWFSGQSDVSINVPATSSVQFAVNCLNGDATRPYNSMDNIYNGHLNVLALNLWHP